MSDQSVIQNRPGWALLVRGAAALVLASFAAVVAVQLADVSIVDDLKADLILVIGGSQWAAFLWMIHLRNLGCTWAARMLALGGLEAALALVVIVNVPWSVFASGTPQFITEKFIAERNDERTIRDSHRAAQEPGQESVSALQVDLSAITPHDSPAFRGARRDGVCAMSGGAAVGLERDWSSRPPRQLWRKEIGGGWSTFVVVGDYCVTQEQRGEFEAVVCYELRTGRERWAHQDRAQFRETAGGNGPRATPTIHGGKVYALGATGILNCLHGTTGMPVWSVDILADNGVQNCRYGMTGSPLVSEPYVIVSPGGAGSSLVAYDHETGTKLWSDGSGQASYSSPQPARLGGVEQVLIFNAEGIFGHELNTGQVRWHFPWISNPEERNNVCQPVILPAAGQEPDRVFISSGYGKGCALLEVRPATTGIVPPMPEGFPNGFSAGFTVQPRWSNRNLKAKFTSVVVHGQHVYGLDERVLTCIDLKTGERCWKSGHYGFGQLILAGDLLVVQTETGEVALVEATPNHFHELGNFAALEGRTWNHPVLAGPLLVVRNDHEAACYELPLAEVKE